MGQSWISAAITPYLAQAYRLALPADSQAKRRHLGSTGDDARPTVGSESSGQPAPFCSPFRSGPQETAITKLSHRVDTQTLETRRVVERLSQRQAEREKALQELKELGDEAHCPGVG